MDEIKLLIREKKDQMDIDQPDQLVWENIRKLTETKSNYKIKLFAAASIILILLSSALIFQRSKTSYNHSLAVKVSKNPILEQEPVENKVSIPKSVASNSLDAIKNSSLIHNNKIKNKPVSKTSDKTESVDLQNSVLQGFGEMQKSFAIIINQQINNLRNTPLYNAAETNSFTVFKKEFQSLNVDEENTKLEVYQSGLHGVQIEKLINIYQQKISLLKRLQSEINKVNIHSLKDSTGITQKLKPTYLNI